MSDFINKVISIHSKEETATKDKKNTTVKLIDQDGVRYLLFKKKKDGNFSSAYEEFKNIGLDEGSTVQISYVIESYTGSDGTERTSNKVTSFRETSEEPVKGQAIAPRPQAAKNTYHKEEEKDEKFWDKKAYKQCLWNYWLQHHSAFKNVSTSDGSIGNAEMDLVWAVFNQIEKDAEKRFATGWDKAVKTFAPEEDNISVEDIPF